MPSASNCYSMPESAASLCMAVLCLLCQLSHSDCTLRRQNLRKYQTLSCRQHRSAQDRKRPGGKKAAKAKSAGVGWSPMKAKSSRRPPPLVLPETAADATEPGDLLLYTPSAQHPQLPLSDTCSPFQWSSCRLCVTSISFYQHTGLCKLSSPCLR